MTTAPQTDPHGLRWHSNARVDHETISKTLLQLETELAGRLESLPPIVCFGDDWRGDPTSKHHIMRALASKLPLLWVEVAGMRRPDLTRGADVKRIFRRIKSFARGVRQETDLFSVVSPLTLPLPGARIANALNRQVYRWSLRSSIKQVGFREPPLHWVYVPTAIRFMKGLSRRALVYHCVDRWWAFPQYDAKEMRRCHELLCREAAIVISSSKELQDDCRSLNGNSVMIPHGVDWGHFAQASFSAAPRPADLPDDGKPTIGFFGLFQNWVDIQLIGEVARANPGARVVLIGRTQVDLEGIDQLPNVLWLGQKPYNALPAYSRHFDVALIPFKMNDLTKAVNPIKLREYLSAGVPVVSTRLPEVVGLGKIDYLDCVDRADFVAAVRHRIDNRISLEERKKLTIAMADHSWLGRCVTIVDAVRKTIG